jgi:hypothetical protein
METQKRYNNLLPNGIPRYIRVYDNNTKGAGTFDRYTVVFTGRYNKSGIYYEYLGMSAHPFHPQGFGQHGESNQPIDRPTYSHLGKKITFDQLPEDCKLCVLQDYKANWNL